MSKNKPGQRKSPRGDRVQNQDIEDGMNAGAAQEKGKDQDDLSAATQAGTEDEEDRNGRAQQSASGSEASQGGKRRGP